MPLCPARWCPSWIQRHIETLGTSTNVIRVETDQGEGFLKALGNPEGPHALACEWVATRLADLVGLPTLDYALLELTPDDRLPFLRGGYAAPGPAFITRRETGIAWGGDAEGLSHLVDRNTPVVLAVFDSWIANCDRYSRRPDGQVRFKPDNVWLSYEGMSGLSLRMKAMDHSHAFTCGRHLSSAIAHLRHVRDETIYGVFPAFAPLIERGPVEAACARIAGIPRAELSSIIDSVPVEWAVDAATRDAWLRFLIDRAAFLQDHLPDRLVEQKPLDL